MAILVTGGAGFIGSHCIAALLSGSDEKIVCLDNFNDYYSPAIKWANVAAFRENARVKLVAEDFCNPQAVQALFGRERIARVVHLGAYAGVRASFNDPRQFEASNVGGTLVLLEAARRHPVERFIFVSSSTVYGARSRVPFCEDERVGTPLSPYGVTKLAAEMFCGNYREHFGLPIVCVRPFSVYGPRVRPDLALPVFAAAILAGRPVPLNGDGSVVRDFTHVSDVCAGLLAALTAPDVLGQAINLGHNQPCTMRQLIELLAEVLQRPARIDFRPPLAGDLPVTCADLTLAKRLLGYAPRVPLADGLREFADWFRSHAASV